MSILAIDQGTTSTRALNVIHGHSKIVLAREHRQIYPHSGWVEHDPEELIRNIQSCIDHCDDISAIGIDNQGESCLAWDAQTKEAVSNIIVWQDNRTQRQIEQLKSDGAQALVLERSGLQLDSYFSATKLAWILENIPEAKALHHKGRLRLGTTDAFFLDRLTGRFVTDITTASRTSLFNLETGHWDIDLCELFGVPIETLPDIVSTTGDFGSIRSKGKDIPVTASIVDQQASLYGHGCRHPGDAKITFGTGAFALTLTGNQPYRSPEQGLLPTVAWQLHEQAPMYALDGGVYCAGSAINWAKSLGLFNRFDELNHFSNSSAMERDIIFVPALSGLACPHWDRRASGLWIGLSLDTTPADLMQSVLEGIVFRAAEVIDAMHNLTPVEDSISIDGGVTANPYFCQFLSNVLNKRVTVQQFPELTALGTASLASDEPIHATDANEPGIRYEPTRDLSICSERFSEAVIKSRNWQRR